MNAPDQRASGRRAATAIGGIALLLWATLALLTTLTGEIPPMELMALAFAFAGALSIARDLLRRRSLKAAFTWPLRVWALGLYGIFGFHLCYFVALRTVPPAEGALVTYLWPLLIVLLSALLPGERLRWWHLAGAFLGLSGVFVLLGEGPSFQIDAARLPGFAAALAAAVIWSTYSVLSRRFPQISSDSVGAFCAASALLAAIGHLMFERTIAPSPSEWAVLAALGIGPLGIALFTWDHGMKHGSIRALGATSYAEPVLTTLLLLVFGRATASWSLFAACVLVTLGAVIGSLDLLRGERL